MDKNMWTLLQRMEIGNKGDVKTLRYDYMGAAEYEFGATLIPRILVSQDDCTVITDAVLNWPHYGLHNVNVHIRYPTKLYEKPGKQVVADVIHMLLAGKFQNKIPAVYSHRKDDTVAWLMLEHLPMMIYRLPYQKRAEEYFADTFL